MSQRDYHEWRITRAGLALSQVEPLFMLPGVATCKAKKADTPAFRPKVKIARAQPQTVPHYLRLTGGTETSNAVMIHCRVDVKEPSGSTDSKASG